MWPSSTATRLQWAESLAGSELDAVVAGEGAEELAALLFLELFFFALDKGDDVAEDVERGDAGVAGAADRLHRGDEEAFYAEMRLIEGRERQERGRWRSSWGW